ncbi:hypothetical protein BDK51DRAFT_38776 [Blyttiomyces helicus]|uniref:SH3 domain-containing protein n=1 Tax=Blyttiomyces helicus TaxID=388810 RepID=A0A4P9W5A9_9FUNG|nr:hypothetical protein BDK51DRAFT_38776 [Blyttiomyces helicus]|eukprot:RKO87579.1 hypothetical protein BDK51DRAFT_38776 [Blyttiomyces helicus]
MSSHRASISSFSHSTPPPTRELPPGSFAHVLYDYAPAPSAEEEIAVAEGDLVEIVSSDDGSGWTLVAHGPAKGLVPTSYIESFEPPIAVHPPPADIVPSPEKGDAAVAAEEGGKQSGEGRLQTVGFVHF